MKLRFVLLAAALVLVSACEPPLPEAARSPPAARPAVAPATPDLSRSNRSAGLARYYARVQFGLKAQGLLRTDYDAADAPFSARDLVENFERIALYQEYANVAGRIVARQTESQLHKWVDPVRLQLAFGDGVPDDVRLRDTAAVRDYAARLARVSGHPIRMVEEGGNFHVLIVDEDSRERLGATLDDLIPGISDERGAHRRRDAALQTIASSSRSTRPTPAPTSAPSP